MANFSKPVLAMAAAWLISSAEAAQPGDYDLKGYGTNKCATWTAWRREKQAGLAEQWILGFLSGVGYEVVRNSAVDNLLNGVDANAVWAWVDNYCLASPLNPIENAGAAFVVTHRPRHNLQ